MSEAFRGTPRGNQPEDFDGEEGLHLDNAPLEGQAEIPPGLKLVIGVCEVAFGAFTNVAQVTTTTIAIISMILGASTVAVLSLPDMVHRFPWYALIGIVIAGAIQLFLHKNAQPMSSTWHRLRHIQDFHIKSSHALADVQNAITINTIYFLLALAADIISDATFVNLYTHNGFVILFWIVFLTGSSTLLLYDGWTRVWGAIEDYKDYRAYHRMYEPEEHA